MNVSGKSFGSEGDGRRVGWLQGTCGNEKLLKVQGAVARLSGGGGGV